MQQFLFESFDNEKLNCYLWESSIPPKGIVLIVHGLQEHGLRYKNFAEYLSQNGFHVLASDQRLHGLTAGKNIGKTDIRDVFPVMVKDQMQLCDFLIKKYNKPLIILGHSYGSFIVQSLLQNYHKCSGAILSGSAYMKRADTLAGKIVAKTTAKFKGGEKDAQRIEQIVIHAFNKPFAGNGCWISANKENVEEYEKDPLCGNPLCINFYSSMFKNVRTLYSKDAISKVDPLASIFIASGQDDPVGKMGESTTKLYQFYKDYGINVKLKLYPNMRHEILNETGKLEVYKDFLEFIKECCKASKH